MNTQKKGFVDLNEHKTELMVLLDCYLTGKAVGSITEESLKNLHQQLHYEDYCIAHHMNYDEMTDDDFVTAEEQMTEEEIEL